MRLVAACAFTAGLVCRSPAPRAGLFPDSSSQPEVAPLSKQDLVGFWTVYDDLAADDASKLLDAGQEPDSMFSATMVLRADGKTSRGSEFPGGEWSIVEKKGRKALRATLRNRARREEWKLDGTLFRVSLDAVLKLEREMKRELRDPADAGLQAPEPASPAADGMGSLQLRVVGNASRWDVSDPAAPALLSASDFSMVKMEVDRGELTPTIKPFSRPVDPEEVRREQEWRRLRDETEAEQIRRAIEEVRELRRTYGEEAWREQAELKEGVDFWKLGEEPGASPAPDDANGGQDAPEE